VFQFPPREYDDRDGGADYGAATTSTIPPRPLAHQDAAYVYSLGFARQSRSYRLHVPPAAAGGAALPLVINLHGYTQNARLQEFQSGMDPYSDRDGYLALYPDGTKSDKVLTPDPVAGTSQFSWNAGACCGLPATQKTDDVRFLLAVIADAATHTPVDLRRVYVTGMSAGGMMAYRMANEASDHIAAVASVAGQVEQVDVKPARPIATLEFHSVDDPDAKWVGTATEPPETQFSVMQGIAKWVKADGCHTKATTGTTVSAAAGSTQVGNTATLVTYSGCKAGVQVALWRMTGSGHVWPGSTLNTGPPSTWILGGVGRGTTVINADELMWRFFQQYELPAS
jgi:polyhydroxybutyrate depolymerase